jgi:hypothetical protein
MTSCTRTIIGYTCSACTQAFSTHHLYKKHRTLLGGCIHPLKLGLTLDVRISHKSWAEVNVSV